MTREQQQTAWTQSQKEEKPYAEIVVQNKYLSEDQILAALAVESKRPPVKLENITPDEKVIQSFREEWTKAYEVLPLARINNILTIAVANPFDVLKLDDLHLITGCIIRPVVSLEGQIREAVTRAYHADEKAMEDILAGPEDGDLELDEQSEEDVKVAELTAAGKDAPIVKFVNAVLDKALSEGASDIHIEPFEKSLLIRYRKDGVLHEAWTPPKKVFNALVSRIKIMTGLDIAEHRIPQDGKFQIRYKERRIDFRVSILPSIHGEKVVMRVLDSSSITLGLDALGFEPQARDAFRQAVNAPYGLLLVTGPTGSGKSTTLYSALKEMLSPEDNIMTVEDPVEYQVEGVSQVPINPKRGLTFAGALRAILRQDPNKIMVGEIRDSETAEIAIKASITGHLVLSTLHTNDAASSISRLIDMGVDPFLVASSVILIAAQRLARKLCEACKQPYDKLPPLEKLIEISFTPEECKNLTLYRAVGCDRCRDGYKGRFAFLEALAIDDEIRKMIIRKVPVIDVKEYAIKHKGMVILRRCGIMNIMRGKTSIEEVLRMTEV